MTAQDIDRRSLVVIGELPFDFLRITPISSHIKNLQQNDFIDPTLWTKKFERLENYHNTIKFSLTIGQAQLSKNYGLTRMDPYCRITIGATVFETPTSANGARNPVWNKVIIMSLSPNISHIFIEMFDERAFTEDSRFAWANIALPERVFTGEQVTDWFPLSGKQGEYKEGSINLVFTLLSNPKEVAKLRKSNEISSSSSASNDGGNDGENPNIMRIHGEQILMDKTIDESDNLDGLNIEDEKIKLINLKLMFPDVEELVISSVLEAVGGNVEICINSLLDFVNA